MRSFARVFGLAVVAAGLSFAQASTANAGCLGFSGTADGFDQETGVSRAQLALCRRHRRLQEAEEARARSPSPPCSAKPQPYWRDSVWDELFYKPDIVKSNSYTICWHGVVSPYVCTSGAKVCW